MSKYDLNSPEERYQLGSDNQVLINKLCITDTKEMDELESGLLLMLYRQLFGEGLLPSRLSFEHIQRWHYQWLGNVYEWAGKLRNTNLAKDGFQFASAGRIPVLLANFDKRYLSCTGELRSLPRARLVSYLAECHVEFILIHPFREGNGRMSRLLCDAQSVLAGKSLLDYSLWDKHKIFYFKAIQAGITGNYKPMTQLVDDILAD